METALVFFSGPKNYFAKIWYLVHVKEVICDQMEKSADLYLVRDWDGCPPLKNRTEDAK